MPEKKVNSIILTILLLYPLVGIGIDLITPSLPSICVGLQISPMMSKNLITIFLISYAISNLVCGFLSDAIGRRKLLLGGLLLFTIASLLPPLFPSYSVLFFGRLLQGVAIGAFASIARAVLSDIVPEARLRKTFAWLATMWGIGPIIGPIIGGYLQHYFGWQSCFYFFALVSAIGFLVMFFTLTETIATIKPFDMRVILSNFKTITSNPAFISIVSLMGAAYSLLIVFNTLGPFVIQSELHKSSIYFGDFALLMGCVFLMGTIICRHLVQNHSSEAILRVGTLLGVITVLLSLAIAQFCTVNVILIGIPSALLFLLTGIMYPTAMGMGVSLFRNLAGDASAIMNFINVGIVTTISFCMSLIDKGSDAIFWAYGFLMLIIVICYSSIAIRKNIKPA